MRTITLIILHCSATRADRHYSMEQCRNDHIHHNGWSDIGYHYYIERDGTLKKGRPEATKGAHVHNHNNHSIGVCYEGGLDSNGQPCDTRTDAQKRTLWQLLCDLHNRYPRAIILGHRDLSPDRNGDGKITRNEWQKECPCFDALADYATMQPEGFW